MMEVVESNWTIFIGQMDSVRNMDDLISKHRSFLDRILTDALLTPRDEKLYRQLMKIFDLVLRFELIQ